MNISQTVPELPVWDVTAAQAYSRDRLGFTIGWHHEQGRIGAVSHGACATVLHETDEEIHPAVFWIHTDDADAAFQRPGAEIVQPVADTAWGLRQFTLRDLCANLFHFHHELQRVHRPALAMRASRMVFWARIIANHSLSRP